MKKIIPKINIDKKDFKKALARSVGYKRLFFMIFFGTLLIFTVDIVYKYAFININFINYAKESDFLIIEGRINNVNLNRVLKNIDGKNNKIKTEISKKYRDPFDFEISGYSSENVDEFY